MPEFMFRGKATLTGAVFIVNAADSQAAIERVRQGKFDDWDDASTELVDWEIDPGTCEKSD